MNPKKNETTKSNKNNPGKSAVSDKHSPAEHQKFLAAQKTNTKVTSEKSDKRNPATKK